MTGEGTPADPTGANPAKKPQTDKPKDWWDGFRAAVEDPNVNTYEYLRDQVAGSLDLDGAQGLGDAAARARRKALGELFELKDPKELSQRLQALEKNKLLFAGKAAIAIKLCRVILDSYIAAQEERTKDAKEGAVGRTLAEERLTGDIEEIARTLEGKDREEIRRTVRQAAEQLSDESTVARISADVFGAARRLLKPATIAEVAILALPLVTWQYRWAVALGLGAYVSRKSVYHGYRAAEARYRGDIPAAKAEAAKAVTALKAAGGNILVIGASPLVGKAPKALAGFINLAVSTSYGAVIDAFKDMLADEEKKPGSTPVSKSVKAGVGGFLKKNRDTLANLSVKMLHNVRPSTVTKTVANASDRVPLSRLSGIFQKAAELGVSLSRRFNSKAAAPAADEDREKLAQVTREAGAIGHDLTRAAADAVAESPPAPAPGPPPPPAPL